MKLYVTVENKLNIHVYVNRVIESYIYLLYKLCHHNTNTYLNAFLYIEKTFIESSENPTTNLRSKSTISFKWKKYVTISYIANAAS